LIGPDYHDYAFKSGMVPECFHAMSEHRFPLKVAELLGNIAARSAAAASSNNDRGCFGLRLVHLARPKRCRLARQGEYR
jgi:hypothetical protein